ncbi:UTP--glucose-1-phosphate uridylyltransferase GalU [Neisseria shayeganii]|uniref:UTP--glucose-1-phosphate uridylyltransferase n=1 Tax=Neisseria shayeganii 871 TaxID=1032488 RepID=G4CIA6_9NEIS|nr:UTP--glucose-1-phosphate uridylyltransferase GalU [Neisseria shayeganii]EGY52439.1 UTP-glucose-1-phosphate uridylyltransferase [Neisseria shayeganii 871]
MPTNAFPNIKKAVFPVAGMGTRFLPATKASPKEMLPIVDKPLIQYAVEEAVAAGCTELIFVTGRNKRSIEDHFDKAYELESELAQRNKTALLAHVQDILPAGVTCMYIRQAEALGLGHAVLCAQAAVGNEPFAVILADDLIDAPQGAISQMVEIYQQTGNSVLGVETVEPSQTGSYGIVEVHSWQQHQRISSIVEKPKPEEAPSNLAVVGRYLLTPRIFDLLTTIGRGAGGEIQLTDGIAKLLEHEPVLAHAFEGKRYDCGSKLGYLEATLAYGLKHPETAETFRSLLKSYAADPA